MEINNMNGLTSPGKISWTGGDTDYRKRPSAPREDVSGLDKVDLMNYSGSASRLNEMIHTAPDVRELLVKELLFAIESNVYDVNSEQVAEKIMTGDRVDEFI